MTSDFSKNNVVMIKNNFVLSLTSVFNLSFSLPICFKWKDDTLRKSISKAFTKYCSDKSPCNLRHRYIVIFYHPFSSLLAIKLFSSVLDVSLESLAIFQEKVTPQAILSLPRFRKC